MTELDPSQFARPILVLGMLQRTGTHYLFHLLQLHPDIATRDAYEDDLLGGVHHLDAYVDAVTPWWSTRGPQPGLLGHIGDGIVSWLGEGADGKRVVAKFPDVGGAARCHDLFPNAKLLVLVRDGRSVTESAVRTWGSSYAHEATKWASAAQTVLGLRDEQASAGRRRLVRYEDLLTRLEHELESILRFCELDPEAYDFGAARALPLFGSSTPGGSTESGSQAGFTGLSRWSGWDVRRHRRFNALAGEAMRSLGYELEDAGSAGPWLRPWARAYAVWFAFTRTRPVGELTRRRPFRSVGSRLRQRRRAAVLARSAAS